MTSTDMKVSGSSAGSRRLHAGRVVVVADEKLAGQVRQAVALSEAKVQVIELASFLLALGEVGQRPVAAVIGPVDAMSGMACSTARSLRRLAPDARLLVTASAEQQAQGHMVVDAGFDACLLSPVDGGTLASELGLKRRRRNDAALPAMEAEGAKHSEEARAGQSDGKEASELGDVDLVEALLGDREAFGPLAMRMIAGRSGLAGVGWVAHESEVPMGHVSAPIRFEGQTFGLLHATGGAARREIGGWAGWLSRWLALDARVGELEELAMRDELTGLRNRRYFNRFLAHVIKRAGDDRSQVTLMLFDIDDFKLYNDKYGHPAGDEILEGIGRLMQSVVRDHDVVARIGGDEFAVIFWDADRPRRPNSKHPQDVLEAAKRFQKAVCSHRFPKLLNEAMGTLTISGGLASFPWDGRTPEELLEWADAMALQSKRQGKNAITFGPGARRRCAVES